MSELQIAWCDSQAAPVVHKLTQSAFAPQISLDPPSGATREDLEVVRTDLAQGLGVLAQVGARPVAVARVILRHDYLYVRRLAVDPSFQRQGIASALMRWVHDQAVAMGYGEVCVGVRKALDSNRALYAGLGYQEANDQGFAVELRLVLAVDDGTATS
jgi:predicted N-acetyltransferase YhbS